MANKNTFVEPKRVFQSYQTRKSNNNNKINRHFRDLVDVQHVTVECLKKTIQFGKDKIKIFLSKKGLTHARRGKSNTKKNTPKTGFLGEGEFNVKKIFHERKKC